MKYSTPAACELLERGSIALAEMEAAGFRVDMDYVRNTTTSILKQVQELDRQVRDDTELYRAWRRRFGNSTKLTAGGQLFAALKDLGYEFSGKKTEKGNDKQDKEEFARVDRPAVRAFQKAKNLRNVISTYFGQIEREVVRHADGHWYVHPIFSLHNASTYRPTCEQPNLLNVPKRQEEMMKFVRRAYLPLPGHHLVEPDYSTHEVKVSYCYNGDPVLRKYLEDPKSDMHADMACEMFFLTRDQVDKKTHRHSAKNEFVFAEFFGSVWFQCAPKVWESMLMGKWKVGDVPLVEHLRKKGIKGLGNPEDKEPPHGTFLRHLKEVEKKLWDKFKVYAQWKKDFYAAYLRNGYFEMKTGFVVNTWHGRNDVINYPIQSAAFHCLLQCIIWLVNYFRNKKMKSRVICQVYDCIIISAHPKELHDVLDLVYRVMTKKLPEAWKWINIKFDSEVDVAGKDEPWSELKTWDHTNGTDWHPKEK